MVRLPPSLRIPALPGAWRRAGRVAGLALALAWAVSEGVALHERAVAVPSTAAVDLPPLWAGARALRAGEDPNDAEVLRRIADAEGVAIGPAALRSLYPPSASVLGLPLAGLGWRSAVRIVRWILLGAIVGTAVLASTAALSPGSGGREARPRVDRMLAASTAAAVATATLLHLRLSGIVLRTGQISPLVTLLAAAALLALARGRFVSAGGLAGLGVALKLAPLALLPALLAARRWVAAGLLLLVPGLLLAVASGRADGGMGWLRAVPAFVDGTWFPEWGPPAGPTWWLWRGRFLLGLPVALLWVAVARRPHGPEVTARLGILLWCWTSLCLAGSHHQHEAFLLAPALAFTLAGPWIPGRTGRGLLEVGALAATLVATGAWKPDGPRADPGWLWVGLVLSAGLAAQVLGVVGSVGPVKTATRPSPSCG